MTSLDRRPLLGRLRSHQHAGELQCERCEAADRIEELEAERDRWKKAASGWARKWNMLECDFCGSSMAMTDGPHQDCEDICEDECLGPCGNGTGELDW